MMFNASTTARQSPTSAMASTQRAPSADSSDTASCITVGGPASASSTPISRTPPTSISESSAAFSTSPSIDQSGEMSRSMRKRGSQPEYNLKKLAGTAVHTRRLYLGLPTRAEMKALRVKEKTEKAAQFLLTSAIAADSELEEGPEDATPVPQPPFAPRQTEDASAPQADEENDKVDAEDNKGREAARSLRDRSSKPLYNLTFLSGTDHHIRRGFLSNEELAARDARRKARKSLGRSSLASTPTKERDGVAEPRSWGSQKALKGKSSGYNHSPLKKSTSIGAMPSFMSNAMSAASTKIKGAAKTAKEKLSALGGRKRKSRHMEDSDLDEDDEPPFKKPRVIGSDEEMPVYVFDGEVLTKKFELKGRFVGQDRGIDPRYHNAKSKTNPESIPRDRKYLPLPMFRLGALLDDDKDPRDNYLDYKLPYTVMNRRNHVLNRDWKEVDQSRFIGEAKQKWNQLNVKKQHENSFCSCSIEDGCEEDCLNRCTNVECDKTNCKLPQGKCANRRFADLDERLSRHQRLEKHPFAPIETTEEPSTKPKATTNPYDMGIEVIDTDKRGRGVRAIRTFEANQIIMEYCGEIVTQAEMDRRMNEDYRDKYKHFYLMQLSDFLPGLEKMVIDATKRGSVARFVNHSCEPNCRIEQVVVDGRPRVGLFATRKVYTGEELTYDYNFSPFSDDNVQTCYCGSDTCRGFLGPKPSRERLKEIEAELQRKLESERKRLLKLEKQRLRKESTAVANDRKRKISVVLTAEGNANSDAAKQPPEKKQKGWKGWVSLEIIEAEKRLKAKMKSQPSIREARLQARQSLSSLPVSEVSRPRPPPRRRSASPKRSEPPVISQPVATASPPNTTPKPQDPLRKLKQTTLNFPSFSK